jgi:hypothetical protein
VEDASLRIAERHGNDEFAIVLSRLADIENKGTIPSLYKLYSLCAIYRLDPHEVLQWYGVDFAQLPADAAASPLERTHGIGFRAAGLGSASFPIALDPGIDISRTTYLSRMIQRWGVLPLMLLNGLDPKTYRYAFIGTDDWSMYPVIHPGALVVVDESRRKVVTSGWSTEFERPVYFIEHRGGYACGWCSLDGDRLIFQPHPGSQRAPVSFNYPDEVDVIGQVTGVAMQLDLVRGPRERS